MTETRLHVNHIFTLLGEPLRSAVIRSPKIAYMQRAYWGCGCWLDFVHKEVGAFQWEACSAHQEFDLSSLFDDRLILTYRWLN